MKVLFFEVYQHKIMDFNLLLFKNKTKAYIQVKYFEKITFNI